LAETQTPAVGGDVIHVVEDDDAVRDALSRMLGARGFRIFAHASAIAFLDALTQAEPGAIVTDVTMPGMSGVELLRELRARGVGWPAVIISGRATSRLANEAATVSATAVLDKPFEPAELVDLVQTALRGR